MSLDLKEKPKTAFITGITGQDGSYLAEFLLNEGYVVHGLIRRTSSFNTDRIDHIYKDPHESKRIFLHYGDILDGVRISELIRTIQPDEIYHLAAMSHVKVSFDEPVYSVNANTIGTLNILEAIRNFSIRSKFYNASSSEMYGMVKNVPQNEDTPFYPRSPYACGKAYSHYQTVNYREAYGIFACNGILFNHEGERRGETFVTRKITRAATRIKEGLQKKLFLGNLEAKRDWGYYKDYVKAMYLMLQHNVPDDYVVATGKTHSVQEFLEEVFKYLCLDYKEFVVQDKKYFRPSEVDLLIGDSSKANTILKWEPKVSFIELVKIMVDNDLELAKAEKYAKTRL